MSNTGENRSAIFVAFALQYVFGVISPKTSMRNVIAPMAIDHCCQLNIYQLQLQMRPHLPLLPRLTLDIIHPFDKFEPLFTYLHDKTRAIQDR